MFVPHKRSSSSSSSSDSSSDYLFQVDALKATHSRELNDNIHTDTRSALRKYQNDAPSCDRVAISEEADHRYPGLPSTSQVSDVTDEQMVHGMPPTQTPPVQVMERPGGYDPNRIPSSVFERSTSLTPIEWSAASNESLFSLHIGHNMSFTRDHVLMLGEFGKSGELTESGELMFSPAPAVSLGDTDTARKSVEIKVPEATEGTDEPFKKEATVSEDQTEIKRPPPAVTWNSFKTSNHSDGSGTNGNSFAFPVKKCACPSCYCSNCSRAFGYFTWPSCYFRRPSCYISNCSWAFCYRWNCSHCWNCHCWNCSHCCHCSHSWNCSHGWKCSHCWNCIHCWNCSHKRWCCHSSPILTEEERIASVKEDGEHQSAKTSSSTACHWFSWFSCCKWGSCRCCRWHKHCCC